LGVSLGEEDGVTALMVARTTAVTVVPTEMVEVMALMGRRSESYGCAIQNGEKLETEFIKIPMVDIPLGAMEDLGGAVLVHVKHTQFSQNCLYCKSA
jgi:hypothetical protein